MVESEYYQDISIGDRLCCHDMRLGNLPVCYVVISSAFCSLHSTGLWQSSSEQRRRPRTSAEYTIKWQISCQSSLEKQDPWPIFTQSPHQIAQRATRGQVAYPLATSALANHRPIWGPLAGLLRLGTYPTAGLVDSVSRDKASEAIGGPRQRDRASESGRAS